MHTEADSQPANRTIDEFWGRAIVEPGLLEALGSGTLEDVEFRRLAANLPTLCWIANADGYIVWYNQRWHDYCGSTPESMEGWGWQSVHDPQQLPLVMAAWTDCIAAQKPFEMVFPLRGADGIYRPFLTRGVVLKDDSAAPRRWFGINVDISQQRASEDALRESEHALSQALNDLKRANARLQHNVAATAAERDRLWESSPDLLAVIDSQRVLQRVNPAWAQLLGYEPSDLIHQRIDQLVYAEDSRATAEAFELATRGKMPRLENRHRHQDGSLRWFSWVAAQVGEVSYATGRDITADKKAAEALGETEEALRQSQKVEAVGQLTGGVAHDFNNLLTVIKGSIELLRRPNVTEERRQRYIDAISDTADRAVKLTSQLLSFARRQALKPEVFDIGASVEAMRDMIRSLTGSRIKVVITLPDQPCFVNADRSQFDTAIVNMAVNARDAMDGQGDLTISVTRVGVMPALRSHPAMSGAFAAIALTDTGAGIPASRIEKIFEPFFTTKRVGQGTGLGLSQVFGFAKQSGGDIVATSPAGAGATFTMYLPLAADVVATEEDQADDQPSIGKGARILVVEDNAEVGAFATDALCELGYSIVLAMDGATALAELGKAEARFDVVFSDVVMPGMSGVELGHEIRRLYPALPVILTSGYSTVLAQDGTHGFPLLHKPYSIEALSQMLQTVADARRRRIGG